MNIYIGSGRQLKVIIDQIQNKAAVKFLYKNPVHNTINNAATIAHLFSRVTKIIIQRGYEEEEDIIFSFELRIFGVIMLVWLSILHGRQGGALPLKLDL